jgi:TetR/AcrR family transcriptional regulator
MERSDEIINAAQELFSNYGFSKTTMTDIAKKLDTSKASLYYYFKDKESIFKALAVREQAQFVEEIEKIITDSYAVKLKKYTIKRIELLQRLLTLSNINRENYSVIKPLFSSLFKEFRIVELNLVKDMFQKGVLANEFKEFNCAEYAELFLDVLRGLRRGAFIKSDKQEITILPTTEFEFLKKQSSLFTDLFLNSILK